MLKKSLLLIFSFVMFAAFTNLFAQKATYIGSKKCKMCHMKDGTAKVWEKSKHATAFKTLQSEESKKLSKGKPADQNPDCLGCHSLSANKEDGIGCEVCHGPGSNYMKLDVMKDKAKAKAAGLLMPKDDSKMCEKCHNKRSPTYKDFKYKVDWPKIAHPAKKA